MRSESLVGKKYGRLTVVERHGTDKYRRAIWRCQCDCGEVCYISTSQLNSGSNKSCGCLLKGNLHACKTNNLTGQRFGSLTVVEPSGKTMRREVKWLCKCDCGNEVVVRGSSLRTKHTTTCGHCNEVRIGDRFSRLLVKDKLLIDVEGKNRTFCKCECDCGKEVLVRVDGLTSGRTHSCGCYYKETVYKGGATPIKLYLRKHTEQWVRDAIAEANYTCELSGEASERLNVHHLYGFSNIVIDAHEDNNINIHNSIGDYTEKEMELLIRYIKSWHDDSSNAVVLSEKIHRLFHLIYGFGDNTLEQFTEFRERYLNGDFKEEIDIYED